MSPVIFHLNEREEMKTKMLETGIRIIKEQGITHTSVAKVMKDVNLGKGTFYHFFSSKEHFIYEITVYQRDKIKQKFNLLLNDKEKLTKSEALAFLHDVLENNESIYKYLTPKDEQKLAEIEASFDKNAITRSQETMRLLFTHIDGLRSDLDYELVYNLVHVLVFTAQHKNELFPDAYLKTIEIVKNLLIDYIFKEDSI